MLVSAFIQRHQDYIQFTREQASRFAKTIADDFNPLHDVTAKRFCVPGDLLFSTAIAQAGVYQNMTFEFDGMVTEQNQLQFPTTLAQNAKVIDQQNKALLTIHADGNNTQNQDFINGLTQAYVGFSGQTFPHILVELMQQHQVMINPQRPMIMYQSMSVEFTELSCQQLTLEYAGADFELEGKRANVTLNFIFKDQQKIIGTGKKRMLLSGLRDYDQQVIDQIVADYNQAKKQYSLTAAA